MAEPAPRLHAWVRCRRRTGELDHVGRRAGADARRHPARRGADHRTAADLLRGARPTCRFVVVNREVDGARLRGCVGRDAVHVRRATAGSSWGASSGGRSSRWRFRDANLLISGQLDADSRILINRSIEARAAASASVPHVRRRSLHGGDLGGLRLDLGCVHDVRRVPLLPGASTWPRRRPASSDPQEVNYMRNSVKAVVDAYDGSVTYYADLDEPDHAGVGPRVPRRVHVDRRRVRGAAGPLPVSGEPVPGPGVPFRQLSRRGSGRVLPQAGLLGDPERPDAAARAPRRWTPRRRPRDLRAEAAAELPAHEDPWRARGAIPPRRSRSSRRTG